MTINGFHLTGPFGPEAGDRLSSWLPVYRAGFAGPPWNSDVPDVAAYRDRIGSQFDTPGFRAFEAVTDDGELLGVAYGWPHRRTPNDGMVRMLDEVLGGDADDFWLLDPIGVAEVMVAPEARGRGVARALLGRIAPPSRAAWLATHADSDANAFYERLGWAPLGTTSTTSGVPLRFYAQHPGQP